MYTVSNTFLSTIGRLGSRNNSSITITDSTRQTTGSWKVEYLSKDAGSATSEGLSEERTVGAGGAPKVFVAHDADGGVEELAEDGRGEAAVETEHATLPPYLRGDSEGVARGRGGGGRADVWGLAVELEPGLYDVYRKRRGLRHRRRQRGEGDLGEGPALLPLCSAAAAAAPHRERARWELL